MEESNGNEVEIEECLICRKEIPPATSSNDEAIGTDSSLEDFHCLLMNGDFSEFLRQNESSGVIFNLVFCATCKSNLAFARKASQCLDKARKSCQKLETRFSWELKKLEEVTDLNIMQIQGISNVAKLDVPNEAGQGLEGVFIRQGIVATTSKLHKLKQSLKENLECLAELEKTFLSFGASRKSRLNAINLEENHFEGSGTNSEDEMPVLTPIASPIPLVELERIDIGNQLRFAESLSSDKEKLASASGNDSERSSSSESATDFDRDLSKQLIEAVKTLNSEKIRQLEENNEEYLDIIKNGLKLDSKFNKGSSQAQKDAIKLIKKLRCVPLALQLAVSYIKTQKTFVNSFSISDYLKELAKNERKAKRKSKVEKNLEVVIKSAVNKTLQISTTKILKSQPDHIGEMALFILDSAAYLNSNIKQTIFQEYSDCGSDKAALEILQQYHLVLSESEGVFNVHPMIQEITRLHLRDNGDEKKALETTLQMIMDSESSKDKVSHILAIFNHIWENEDLSKEKSDQVGDCLWEMMMVGKYDEGVRFGEKALEILSETVGDNHRNYCRVQFYLAQVYTRQGHPNKSILELKNLLRKVKEYFKEDVGFILAVKTDLAGALRLTGEIEESLGLQMEVVSKKKLILGETHPEAVLAETNFGLGLLEIGQNEVALKIFQRAAEVYYTGEEEAQNSKELARLKTYISNVHLQTGDAERAISQLDDALELLFPVWTEDSELFLAICYNLGQLLCSLGKYEEALQVMEGNLGKLKNWFGTEHTGVKELNRFICYVKFINLIYI